MAKTKRQNSVASDKNRVKKLPKQTKSKKRLKVPSISITPNLRANLSRDSKKKVANTPVKTKFNTNEIKKSKKNSSATTLVGSQEKVTKQAEKMKKNLEDNSASSKTNPKKVKPKTSQTLALVKSQQRKVSKETAKIKKRIEDGSIIIKPNHKEMKEKAEEKRGLIYIGHIPHGFYEKEMKMYFKQFGKVTNIKVCRSRISGKCKGYGYIEFDHPDVAKIASETMNNYVMFKKRIVTTYVPYEKRPKGLFHGKSSNLENTSVNTRRGKEKYSRNKIQDDKIVIKKVTRSYKKLQEKIGKLSKLGIKCSVTPVHTELVGR